MSGGRPEDPREPAVDEPATPPVAEEAATPPAAEESATPPAVDEAATPPALDEAATPPAVDESATAAAPDEGEARLIVEETVTQLVVEETPDGLLVEETQTHMVFEEGESPSVAFHETTSAEPGDAPPRDAIEGGGEASAPVDDGFASVVGTADRPPDSVARLPSILESLLFAADHPMTSGDLAALVDEPNLAVVDSALILLAAEWSPRGIQLHPVAGGWQFRTHPLNAVWVQRLVAQKPVRLTRAQVETMAIVAYRQPITRPEIDEIRGVDSGDTLKTLLDRSLIRILGKKEEAGLPLLYGTTRDFLEFFNLSDLKELPTLREFSELTEEHRAHVEALERVAPPGTVERGVAMPETLPPLARVELSEAPMEDDFTGLDALIEEAGARAKAVAEVLGGPHEEKTGGAPGGAGAGDKGGGQQSSDEG